MNNLTEFQMSAVNIATRKMLSGNHFSICDLDAIAKVLGVPMGCADYNALRTLHCVNWVDMGKETELQVKQKCLDLLGLTLPVSEVKKEADIGGHDATPKKNIVLRLLGG